MSSLELRFWGVRGSIPAPGPATATYGGNTACVEVRYANQPALILDGGTGLRGLGATLMAESGRSSARILLTHFHWDHIQGIPFFAPLYSPNWSVTFCSACPPAATEQRLAVLLRSPYFPAGPAMRATVDYAQVEAAGPRVGELVVRPFPLRHPDGSTGYRIEAPQAVVVYATDHEHGEQRADGLLLDHARGAGVLIYDAQYTPEEYETRQGWGHSTWLAGTRLAREADVSQLVLFHHDPDRDDAGVAGIVERAGAEFCHTSPAREGWSMTL